LKVVTFDRLVIVSC